MDLHITSKYNMNPCAEGQYCCPFLLGNKQKKNQMKINLTFANTKKPLFDKNSIFERQFSGP